VLVLMAGVLAPLLAWLTGIDREAVAGLFAGASSNTPALGAAQQSLSSLPAARTEQAALAALACAVAYPGAIVGSLGVILLLKALFRIDPVEEAQRYAAERRKATEPVLRRAMIVENAQLTGATVADVCRRFDNKIVVSRIRRSGESEVQTALPAFQLFSGDAVLAVGTAPALDSLESLVGRRSDEDLMAAPGNVTYQKIVITNRVAALRRPLSHRCDRCFRRRHADVPPRRRRRSHQGGRAGEHDLAAHAGRLHLRKPAGTSPRHQQRGACGDDCAASAADGLGNR
jgi:putative transport protein